jgi:rubrerythrin
MKPAQAIRNAVEAELAAAGFYERLAAATREPDAKLFLEQMVLTELEHARRIEEAGLRVLGGPLADRADGDVSTVETLPDWRYLDGIAIEQALEIALSAERQASLYYDALADCFDGAIRELFLELARTEDEHAETLLARR